MPLVPLGDLELERLRCQHIRAGALYEDSLTVFAQIGLADHSLERSYLLHNMEYVALAPVNWSRQPTRLTAIGAPATSGAARSA
jgi:hypothetical protein